MIDLIFLRVLPYCALGALLGAAYFSALGLNVRLYAGSGPAWSAPLLHLARLLLIGAVFTLCARQSASSLLSSVAGFELTRKIAVNRQVLALGEKS
jgi:F1F0 ATPase subunit 2